jgi:hypothetical protein
MVAVEDSNGGEGSSDHSEGRVNRQKVVGDYPDWEALFQRALKVM